METAHRINPDHVFDRPQKEFARKLFMPLSESSFEGFGKTILRVQEHYKSLSDKVARIDPKQFIKPKGLYFEAQVISDMKEAQEVYEKRRIVAKKPIQSFEQRSEEGCWYRDFLADAYESVFVGMSNEFNWFGKDCRIQRTSFEDDVLAGTDCVLEFFDDEENIFTGLKIDVTTSSQRDIRVGKKEDKTKLFLDFLKNGPKARDFVKRQNSVKYFIDNSGKQHEIQPIIPIVLVTNFEEVERLIKAADAMTDNPSNKDLHKKNVKDAFKTHPIQLDYIKQIIQQLRDLKKQIDLSVRSFRAQQSIADIDMLLKKFEELEQMKESIINNDIRKDEEEGARKAPTTKKRRIVA